MSAATTSIRPLSAAHHAAACDVFTAAYGEACRAVAAEKLFARPVTEGDRLWGAFASSHPDAPLVGVMCQSASNLRVLGVEPKRQGRGIGGAMLAFAESQQRQQPAGAARLAIHGGPGNYLYPGVPSDQPATLQWLSKRGYQPGAESFDLHVGLRHAPMGLPLTMPLGCRLAAMQRSGLRERDGALVGQLLAAIERDFSLAWAQEVAAALQHAEGGVYAAMVGDAIAGFAAYNGNNAGLGGFGPMGTWPAYRRHGLGRVLLLTCLRNLSRRHDSTVIAWAAAPEFYANACGATMGRRYVAMTKDL